MKFTKIGIVSNIHLDCRSFFLTFAPLFFNQQNLMELHFTGIIIAVSTFLIIGIFHPIVIKTEYYWGTRPWWLFFVGGILAVCLAITVENVIASSILGIIGASSLWAIGELLEQKKRVEKGWFPMNPKRKDQYRNLSDNNRECTICEKKDK